MHIENTFCERVLFHAPCSGQMRRSALPCVPGVTPGGKGVSSPGKNRMRTALEVSCLWNFFSCSDPCDLAHSRMLTSKHPGDLCSPGTTDSSGSPSTKICWGLPWWSSGWESTCQCRGHVFDPWFRRIPHAVGPKCHDYWARKLQLLQSMWPRVHMPRQEKSPQWEAQHPTTRESPHAVTKTQHSQK